MKLAQKQFLKLLILEIAFLATGCGTTVHTVSHSEAIEAHVAHAPATSSPKGTHSSNDAETEHIYENPIYNMPIEQAWPIVRATLSAFCDGKLAKLDEFKHHLEAKNQNVWSGDTYVTVNLRSEQQRTIVEVSVKDYGWNQNLVVTRSPHILSLFLERLDVAMKKTEPSAPDAAARLQTLDDLKAKGLITDEEYQKKKTAILDGL